MPTKKSASTAKLQLDARTVLKFEELLRKALLSSNILVLEDDIAARIIVTTDNISGRIIVATVDNISGRLSNQRSLKSTNVELDTNEAVRFYKLLRISLIGPKPIAAKGKGSAATPKKPARK